MRRAPAHSTGLTYSTGCDICSVKIMLVVNVVSLPIISVITGYPFRIRFRSTRSTVVPCRSSIIEYPDSIGWARIVLHSHVPLLSSMFTVSFPPFIHGIRCPLGDLPFVEQLQASSPIYFVARFQLKFRSRHIMRSLVSVDHLVTSD